MVSQRPNGAKLGHVIGRLSMPSRKPKAWDTSQPASFQMLRGSLIPTHFTDHLMSNPAKPPKTSPKPSSPNPSKRHTTATLTITIRYTCPHCSEEHFLDFPMSWSTKPKTFHQRITQCSTSSSRGDSLLSVIHGRAFTVSEEQSNKVWICFETAL